MIDITFVGLTHSDACATLVLTVSIFFAMRWTRVTSTVTVTSIATTTIVKIMTVAVNNTMMVDESFIP